MPLPTLRRLAPSMLIAAGAVTAAVPALAALPPVAQDPMALVERAMQAFGHTTFEGEKVQSLTRQTMHLDADMRIYFQDTDDYRVLVAAPDTLAGVNLWLDRGRSNVYFPGESLLFKNDNPSGSQEAAETIFGRITEDPALLAANYELHELPDATVARIPCYVVDITPKRGYVTPGRRFWIAQDTFQVLREQRFWGPGQDPYYDSYYTDFVPARRVDTAVELPVELHQIELKRDQMNSYVTYASLDEAERAIHAPVALPSYLPPGFRLHSVQFANLFGTRITLLSYTDGLNWIYLTYRPKPTLFITMMAGAYAVGLIDKFNELSFQAPYNYAAAERNGQKLYAYGDLVPGVLQQVVNSLSPQPVS